MISPRFERILVTLLFLFALLLSVTSMRTINETNDEVPHIAAGYSYLLKGDFRLNVEHPPLVKTLAALPLLTRNLRFDETSPVWEQSLAWEVGQEFFYVWNSPERIVFISRLPMVGLYLVFGLLLWGVARTLYGQMAGIFALVFSLFTPEIIAHGQLVTTDLPFALFAFATIWFGYRALLLWQQGDILLCCLSCGAMATTKFTAPIIFITLVLVALVYILGGDYLPDLKGAPKCGRRIKRVGLLALYVALATLLAIWGIYRFRYAISGDVEILVPWREFNPQSGVTRLVLWLHSWEFLPEAYLAGILECFKMLPDRPTYLFGEVFQGGRWYYFPVTFLFKTPIPLLLLLIFAWYRRRGEEWLTFLNVSLLLPPVLYLLIAMQSEVNIGNRHILPVYPFLIVWAAKSGQSLTPFRQTPSLKESTLIALLLWLLVGTLSIYPHYLSYFNELAGGPRQGGRILADSNIDWGQDLRGLAEYLREVAREDLYVCYFGTASLKHYLPEAKVLPCTVRGSVDFDEVPSGGLVAISTNHLAGLHLRGNPKGRVFIEKVKAGQLVDHIGYSILLYRMP